MTTITVPVLDDAIREGPEQLFVELSNPLSSIAFADGGGVYSLGVTIDDPEDRLTVSVADVQVVEGTNGTTDANVTVTLSEISGLDVSGQYNTIAGTATSDDNDFAPVIDTLTILAGQLSGTITIDVTADAKFEPDEYFWVRISSPTNADIGQDVAKVTVLNDDDPPFVLTIADVTVNEADGSVDLTVTRMDFAETAAVTAISGTSFMYTTADLSAEAGLDYQGMTGAVGTIPAAQTSVIITIGILQDAIYEGTENFEVTLHDPTEGAISSTTPSMARRASTGRSRPSLQP